MLRGKKKVNFQEKEKGKKTRKDQGSKRLRERLPKRKVETIGREKEWGNFFSASVTTRLASDGQVSRRGGFLRVLVDVRPGVGEKQHRGL